MRIDPQIAALRHDRDLRLGSTQLMQDVRRDWRETPSVNLLLQDLREFGAGSEIEECPALAQLVTDPATASGFVSDWTKCFLEPLAKDPLGEIPFQQSYSRGFASMRIAGSGRASLALLRYEPVPAATMPTSASFSDREQIEIVIAGSAHGLHHTLEVDKEGSPAITSCPQTWGVGERIATAPKFQSRDVIKVEGSFTLLHLSRVAADPVASKSYALDDGALLQQVSGSKLSSQIEMAIAVLGAMGREDAAKPIAEVSAKGPAHLRWEALRQLLSLDARQGFDCLSGIANCAGDELSMPAQHLKEQLVRSHPQLVGEDIRCPA